jgi:hypothetical protein
MTLQELTALPKGTRVRFDLSPDEGYDYGTIIREGPVCEIAWDPGVSGAESVVGIIRCTNLAWEKFVKDISLDKPAES